MLPQYSSRSLPFFVVVSFLFLTGIHTGCSNEVGPGSDLGFWPFSGIEGLYKTGNATHGQIYVFAETSSSGVTGYRCGSELYTSTSVDTSVLGGDIVAGGVSISEPVAPDPYLSFKKPDFGSYATFSIDGNPGNNVPAFTDSLYLPSVIKISSPGSKALLPKGQSVTVNWNSDSNSDTVFLGIEFDPEFNEIVLDTVLTGVQPYRWWTTLEDNGSATIPASVMNSVDSGTVVKIVIGRGKSKFSGASTFPVDIYGYSIHQVYCWID